MKNHIREILREENPDTIVFDDLDCALVAIDIEFRAVYSLRRIINHLMQYMQDEEEAWEYYLYNIEGSMVGMDIYVRPIIIDDYSFDEGESEVINNG